MKVNIMKMRPDAVIPTKAHPTDAGFDLTAVSMENENGALVFHTGLAFEIPENHVGLLFPRSSIAKKDLALSNAVGVIDSGYRGEVTFKFKKSPRVLDGSGNFYTFENDHYKVGERIGQMIILPYPEVEFNEIFEMSHTDRGTGGYGSSGK